MVNPARSGGEQVPRKRRLNRTKGAVAFLFAVGLLIIGNRGRYQAGLQARLDSIYDIRDELQQQLNVNESLPEDSLQPSEGALHNSDPLAARQMQILLESLKTELANFGADYPPGSLSGAEDLRLRSCQATAANAERRFADTLSIITDKDVPQGWGQRETQPGIITEVLEARGDAFYGLRKWQEALGCYNRILALHPDRISARRRFGECQYALGNLGEASTAFARVVKDCNQRGDAFLVRGRPEAAISEFGSATRIEEEVSAPARSVEFTELLVSTHNQLGNALLVVGKPGPAAVQYQKALSIATPLAERGKRDDLTNELAWTHNNLGNALLAQEKAPLAEVEYQKAIDIQAGLASQPAPNKVNGTLAATYKNMGDAALAQGKLDAASTDYGKAIDLIEAEPQPAATQELGISYNNRGVLRRVQGNAGAAVSDFEKAIAILAGIVNPSGHSGPGAGAFSEARVAQVQMDVLFKHGEHGIGALTRTRLMGLREQNEAALALATSLQNRGYALLLKGDLHRAVKDFQQAADLYATLVEEEGHRDLAMEFARSLTDLAWVCATSADTTLPGRSDAKQYAFKACELSEWRGVDAIEALAAACAGRAEFDEAVKWQQKALDLAPEKRRAELMTRLQLYQSGRPYLRHVETGMGGRR